MPYMDYIFATGFAASFGLLLVFVKKLCRTGRGVRKALPQVGIMGLATILCAISL